jgi:hypothetical protein
MVTAAEKFIFSNSPLKYEIAGIGGGRTPTFDDIETSTGVRPVPGDLLFFHIYSVQQSHSPVTGNPAIQLRRDTDATFETEIWGCIVEEGQDTFAFNRGGSSTDDYGWSFLKRISGIVPSTINVDDSGGGTVTSQNINYDNSTNGLTFRIITSRNVNGSNTTAYDDTDTQVTDSTLIQGREDGLISHDVFIDVTGGGRLFELQSSSYLTSYVVLSLN